MFAARLIDVETNHLLANGALCCKRVKAPALKEPEEFNDPYD